jgi:peptidoglycan/xylan/chitin deacetylase (PgdA/CDA1 family)
MHIYRHLAPAIGGVLVLLALVLWPAPTAAYPAIPGTLHRQPPPAAVATVPAEVFRVPAGQGKVALTFDAGEWPGRIDTLLAALKSHHVKATFFLCGIYIDSFPSRARASGGRCAGR